MTNNLKNIIFGAIFYLLLNGFIIEAKDEEIILECKDQNEKCEVWALLGECYQNRGYMYIFCPESCDQCVIRDPKCIDHDLHCAAWSDLGECKSNHKFMKKACRRACSFCLPSSDKTLPYIRTNVVEHFWTIKKPSLKKFKNINRLPDISIEDNLI